MPVKSLKIPLGARLPWFRVTDLADEEWTTSSLPKGAPLIVMFLCAHSPYVRHIETHLGEKMVEIAARGVTALGIASNDPRSYPADAPAALAQQATRAGFRFPYCVDPDQQAAKAFGAACTPEFFVYDGESRCVYHGQYDDSRPGNRIVVSGADLLRAVDAVLIDDLVPKDQAPSFGCSIKWSPGNEPAYVFSYG